MSHPEAYGALTRAIQRHVNEALRKALGPNARVGPVPGKPDMVAVSFDEARPHPVLGEPEVLTRDGWLLPDGGLHPCARFGHDRAAEALGTTADRLQLRGACLLKDGEWFPPARLSHLTRAQAEAIAYGPWREPDWFKPADWFDDWAEANAR